jgi:hypothetical protein
LTLANLWLYNNQGKSWDLVETQGVTHPVAGKKS